MIVLITGSHGFHGLHMTNLSLKRDDFEKVIGVDNLSREYLVNPLSLVNDLDKFKFIRKDFREFTTKDFKFAEKLLNTYSSRLSLKILCQRIFL